MICSALAVASRTASSLLIAQNTTTSMLAVKRADELLRRADAEAFKVEDIRGSNDT